MRERLESILGDLHEDKDQMLILAIKDKLGCLDHTHHSITEKELSNARNGGGKTLGLITEDFFIKEKYKPIHNATWENPCTYDYTVEELEEYHDADDLHDKCVKHVRFSDDYKHLWECKALINKIKNRLSFRVRQAKTGFESPTYEEHFGISKTIKEDNETFAQKLLAEGSFNIYKNIGKHETSKH